MRSQTPADRHRIWSTTNNGFLVEQRTDGPDRTRSPGNLSILSTVSGELDGRVISGNDRNGSTLGKSHRPVIVGSSTGKGVGGGGGGGGGGGVITYGMSNLIGVQSRFRRKYYHRTVLGVLVLLIVLMAIAIIVISVLKHKTNKICQSKECVRTAASLLYSMDELADPCEDFYQFTCGHWADEHPRPDSVTSNDWFRERQSLVMRILRHFLQSNATADEPQAVNMTKQMYKACMNQDLLDKRGLEPLVYYLKKFELPLVPSGLNLTLSAKSLAKYGNATAFNWLRSLAKIKRGLGMDLLIGFDIFPDPLNKTLNRIALGTPDTDSALPFNNDDPHKLLYKVRRKTIFNEDEDDDWDDRDAEEAATSRQTSSGLTNYMHYITKVIEAFIDYLDPDAHVLDIEDSVEEMAMRAVNFAKKVYKLKDSAENTTKPSRNAIDDILYISIADLQNQTGKLIAPKTLTIWPLYLELMWEGVTVRPGAANVTAMIDNITVITSAADILYLQTLEEVLLELLPVDLEFYLWLSVVEELVLHTTSEMHLLHMEYMRQIIGTEGSTPRSLYCSHAVNSLMGMAVSYVLAEDEFVKEKLPKVERMLDDIRRAFDNLVRATSWMDEPTKRETLQKSAEMQSFIGFPHWIRNASLLNEYYDGIEVNASTHLENMVGVLSWRMDNKLSYFHEPEPTSWATSPSNVNAFHTFQANAITIPIAILQYPFYDLGLEALNYGSIGTILGHELTHGFDDSGRMFDKNGNMVQWWSNETINEYVNRTECFVEQYSHYFLSDISEYIDGELTLGENIADNGGMREAFNAYALYVKDVGKERMLLPGMEHYTHEQLFFISFGNLWCETYTPAASQYALEDSHCPGKFRLKGVLSNSMEFARTFNCRKGSGMNPHGPKCQIW